MTLGHIDLPDYNDCATFCAASRLNYLIGNSKKAIYYAQLALDTDKYFWPAYGFLLRYQILSGRWLDAYTTFMRRASLIAKSVKYDLKGE